MSPDLKQGGFCLWKEWCHPEGPGWWGLGVSKKLRKKWCQEYPIFVSKYDSQHETSTSQRQNKKGKQKSLSFPEKSRWGTLETCWTGSIVSSALGGKTQECVASRTRDTPCLCGKCFEKTFPFWSSWLPLPITCTKNRPENDGLHSHAWRKCLKDYKRGDIKWTGIKKHSEWKATEVGEIRKQMKVAIQSL